VWLGAPYLDVGAGGGYMLAVDIREYGTCRDKFSAISENRCAVLAVGASVPPRIFTLVCEGKTGDKQTCSAIYENAMYPVPTSPYIFEAL